MDRVMPTDRIVSDTRKVVYYYRPSPDRSRILFGGRVTSGETDPRRSGALLRRDLVKLFPELATVRVGHSWMGLEIGRAHVCTPVTNAHLVCRLLLEKKKKTQDSTTMNTIKLTHNSAIQYT